MTRTQFDGLLQAEHTHIEAHDEKVVHSTLEVPLGCLPSSHPPSGTSVLTPASWLNHPAAVLCITEF
jgi:hypothetical protein